MTAGAAGASSATLDQVEMAPTGPGGPPDAEIPELVVDTTTADALPPLAEDRCQAEGGQTPNVSGTVEGGATHSSAREALAFYLAAEPTLMSGLYQEIALPDGSHGDAYRPSRNEPDEIDLDAEPVTVLHVPPRRRLGGRLVRVHRLLSRCHAESGVVPLRRRAPSRPSAVGTGRGG